MTMDQGDSLCGKNFKDYNDTQEAPVHMNDCSPQDPLDTTRMGPQFADRITVNKARQVAAETSRVARGAQGREQEVTVVYESGHPSRLRVALARALGFRLQDNSTECACGVKGREELAYKSRRLCTWALERLIDLGIWCFRCCVICEDCKFNC
ncbi:hypothetical protein EDD22DRAFT_851318 [Suillus occidentalis]|nr:hypothetical protein EDD22DRAFT_851318 [Suillus occidentalis]